MDYLTVHEKINHLIEKGDEGYHFLDSLVSGDDMRPAERIHLDTCRASHRAYVEAVAYTKLLKKGDGPSHIIDLVKDMGELAEHNIKRLDHIAELIAGNMRLVELGLVELHDPPRSKEDESDDSSATP